MQMPEHRLSIFYGCLTTFCLIREQLPAICKIKSSQLTSCQCCVNRLGQYQHGTEALSGLAPGEAFKSPMALLISPTGFLICSKASARELHTLGRHGWGLCNFFKTATKICHSKLNHQETLCLKSFKGINYLSQFWLFQPSTAALSPSKDKNSPWRIQRHSWLQGCQYPLAQGCLAATVWMSNKDPDSPYPSSTGHKLCSTNTPVVHLLSLQLINPLSVHTESFSISQVRCIRAAGTPAINKAIPAVNT